MQETYVCLQIYTCLKNVVFTDALGKHSSNTEWYTKHCFYCLLIQEKKTKQKTKHKDKKCKLWVLKITTLSSIQLTNLPQNTTEHLLYDCLFRQIGKKAEENENDWVWENGRRQNQPAAQLHAATTKVYPPPRKNIKLLMSKLDLT